jgi:multidrug efflux pump subunit AcrA (membrane-fusion protein)
MLILLFVAAAVASVVIHVPETVASPFVLVPVGGTDPVRAPVDGFLEVRAVDGQAVRADEVLFVIRSDQIGTRSSELEAARVQRGGAQASLANAEKKYQTQQLADKEAIARLTTRSESLARKLEGTKRLHGHRRALQEAARDMADKDVKSLELEVKFRGKISEASQIVAVRAQVLADSRAISEMELFRIRQEVDRTKLEVEQGTRALSTARCKQDNLQKEHASEREAWQLAIDEIETEQKETAALLAKLRHEQAVAEREHAELVRSLNETISKTGIGIAALEKELERSAGNQISVPAPCAGSVLRLQVKGNGAFVRTGDVLCELAPADRDLQAELTVPSSGVGRIKPEQRARLKYDAFPYQRYGLKDGTVRWVSPASMAMENGSAFRVLVEASDRTVRADGEDRPLRAGMGGRAEVVVGRRSLISVAFEPLRQLRESLSDPGP